MSAAEATVPKPDFTDAELECIRDELFSVAWQREKHYDARASILKKVEAYQKRMRLR